MILGGEFSLSLNNYETRVENTGRKMYHNSAIHCLTSLFSTKKILNSHRYGKNLL